MTEGCNHVVQGWKTIGLLFVIFFPYCTVVEGISGYFVLESTTELSVKLEQGEQGLVPCRRNASIDMVYWLTVEAPTYFLVEFFLFVNPHIRAGPGYEAGLYNITDDFTLIIKDVKPENEGIYVCVMVDLTRNVIYANTTDVIVHKKVTTPGTTSTSLSTNSMVTVNEISTHSTPKKVNTTTLHGFTTIAASTLFTHPTPKIECPADNHDLFIALFGASFVALVVFVILSCYLLLKQRGCVCNARIWTTLSQEPMHAE